MDVLGSDVFTEIILKLTRSCTLKDHILKYPVENANSTPGSTHHLPSSSHASTRDLNIPSAESSDDGVSNSAALPSSITSTKSLSMIVLSR